MSELVSAYPTSGGIYWWAAKLGGPAAGFFTGWLNLIGLVAVTAGVSYGCATFIDLTISTYSEALRSGLLAEARLHHLRGRCWPWRSVLNIFSSHLMAIMNNVSVWWHVAGAVDHRPDPDRRPRPAPVASATSSPSGSTTPATPTAARARLVFWFFILPFGFLLTQYTITGFDASRPPLGGDRRRRPRRRPRASGSRSSTRWSAATSCCCASSSRSRTTPKGNPDNALAGLRCPARSSSRRSGTNWATFVLFISASAQFFCATSCMTSASRMTFAFSRDGAIPGSDTLAKLTATRVPGQRRHVRARVRAAILITLPALIEVDVGTAAPIIPLAFYAVISIAVIGLYLAFAIPIYLRWRHGDKFEVGPWNNGSKYKWMNPIAVAEIVIVSLYLMLPTTPGCEPVQRRVRVEVRQLRADRHPRRARSLADDLVEGVGQELVHRSEAHDRRGGRQGVRGLTIELEQPPRPGPRPGRSEISRGPARRADQPQPARDDGNRGLRRQAHAERRRPPRHRPGRGAREHPSRRGGRASARTSSTTGPTSGCWSSPSCRARR